MTCQNPDYQKVCAKSYKSIPGCEEIDKDELSCALTFLNNPGETGLVLQFFELGKLFVEKKMVKFHAQGTCMYPCLKPGDALAIEPKSASEVEIGDIAVYRRFNRLFAHRAIGKGNDNGSSFIVTRPDTAQFGDDGPTFDKDILGIVTQAERRGKVQDLGKREYSSIKKFILGLYLRFYYLGGILWRNTIFAISYIQQFKLYRLIAKSSSSARILPGDDKIGFAAYAPLNSRINSTLERKIPLEELENPPCRWKLVLKVNSKPAGSLVFISKPQDCPFSGWWLSELKIRIRYRGTDIEQRLWDEADSLFRRWGILKIYAGVFKESALEKMILRNSGFREISAYEDKFLKDSLNLPLKRIIMEKAINE